MTPLEVSDFNLSSGGNIDYLLPNYKNIPSDIKEGKTKWNVIYNEMSSEKDLLNSLKAKEGIDKTMAIRHIKCIMVSKKIRSMRKEICCAYLISEFFEKDF